MSFLQSHTLKRKARYSEELLNVYDFVNKLAVDGGFDEILINPTYGAKVNTYIPFNRFIFPARYLNPVNSLLSFASPTYPKEFATNGLKLMIEQQAQFKEGETLEQVKELFGKREEYLKQDIDIEAKTKVIYGAIRLKQRMGQEYPVSENEITQREEELNTLIGKQTKLDKEQRILVHKVPMQARAQFVEKIKKDQKRNVVEEIATVETLFDLLDAGIVNGITVEEKKVDGYLRERYPDSILDNQTKNNIVIKQTEIRNKLKESY